MIKLRAVAYIILVLILIGLGTSLFEVISNQNKPATALKPDQPDSFAVSVRVVRYNKNGDVSIELTAPKLSHYSANNDTLFFQPKIVLYTKQQQPWTITANLGIAQNGFNIIHLKGNVVLHQPLGPKNQEIAINTNELDVNIDQQIAATKLPITLSQRDKNKSIMIVKSIGMQANKKTGQVLLLSHVRGYYAPGK
jgi:LPS export ABC transporter protein LptC